MFGDAGSVAGDPGALDCQAVVVLGDIRLVSSCYAGWHSAAELAASVFNPMSQLGQGVLLRFKRPPLLCEGLLDGLEAWPSASNLFTER